MFPKVPPPCLPRPHALAREETLQPGMWKGISASFNEVGLLHPSAGLGDAGIPLAGPVSPGRDPAPLGVGLGQHPNGTRGGSQSGAAQLAPSQLCSLVATFQGLCLPFAREQEGKSSPWRRGRVKEAFSQGSMGGG